MKRKKPYFYENIQLERYLYNTSKTYYFKAGRYYNVWVLNVEDEKTEDIRPELKINVLIYFFNGQFDEEEEKEYLETMVNSAKKFLVVVKRCGEVLDDEDSRFGLNLFFFYN